VDIAPHIRLRVVPIAQVRPHEVADPAREVRIERRLRVDDVLRDPVVVGSLRDVDSYVLLDGTNRHRALQSIGCRSILVQELDYADPHAVELRTWCHLARRPLERILEVAGSIEGVDTEVLSPLAAPEVLTTTGTLAVLLDAHERVALMRDSRSPMSRPEQLRHLVDAYERNMSRVDCDPDDLEERAHVVPPGEESLVAFPRFSRSAVVAMALGGALIPAGITRHVLLGGRALRVNLPLDVLREADVERSAAVLEGHLTSLQPRFYQEPTLLFDS
jgi:hypothetical protein